MRRRELLRNTIASTGGALLVGVAAAQGKTRDTRGIMHDLMQGDYSDEKALRSIYDLAEEERRAGTSPEREAHLRGKIDEMKAVVEASRWNRLKQAGLI